jgi:hypothetical protein
MANYYPRRIQPADQLVYDASGNLVGVRSGTSGDETIYGLNSTEYQAFQSLASADGNVTAAALPTLVGTPNQCVRLSDGDDAGALLMWAIPEGSASYAWCWQVWPKAAYF